MQMWGLGRRWVFGEPEQQDPNRSVFSCGRVAQSGSTKSNSYFHAIRSLIFSKIRQNLLSAQMPQQYGHVTQQGWNL